MKWTSHKILLIKLFFHVLCCGWRKVICFTTLDPLFRWSASNFHSSSVVFLAHCWLMALVNVARTSAQNAERLRTPPDCIVTKESSEVMRYCDSAAHWVSVFFCPRILICIALSAICLNGLGRAARIHPNPLCYCGEMLFWTPMPNAGRRIRTQVIRISTHFFRLVKLVESRAKSIIPKSCEKYDLFFFCPFFVRFRFGMHHWQ